MVGDSHRQLVTFLHERTGDSLRAVANYNADNYTVHFIRDDLRRQHVKSDIDKIYNRLKDETRVREQHAFPFGDLTGTVRSFENALVMHFPYPQERGTVITLEPDVARSMNTFMEECEQRIEY